jgi:hypothetical protein
MAKVEKALRHFLQPHSGQQGFLSFFVRTRISKRLLQRSQSYSNIGMSCLSSTAFFHHGDTEDTENELQIS